MIKETRVLRRSQKVKKSFLSVSIPTELKEELKKEGINRGRNLSNYVMWLFNNRHQPKKKRKYYK